MKPRAIGVIILAAVILGGWIIADSQNRNPGKETIKIGNILFLTGPLAALGEQEHNGMRMAVAQVNESGGVKGRDLELVTEDYAGDPKKAVPAYLALKQRGIKFLLVDGGSAVVPVAPLIRKNGDFGMVPVAIHASYFDENPRTCRVALTARDFARAIGDHAIKKFGKPRLAFLVTANEYGNTAKTSIERYVAERGGTTAMAESYDQSASDFRTQILKLKAVQNETDALVIINATNSVEPMLGQLKQLGYSKPILADLFTISNSALKDMRAANGVVFVDYDYLPEPQSGDSPALLEFKRGYLERFGSYPLAAAVNGYDSVMAIAEAMRRVDDMTPDTVSRQIISGGYRGLSGNVRFNSDCEAEHPSLMHVVRDGKVELVD